MANNKIQVKRTNVSGRTANVTNSGNTQYIDAGELALNMADGILYTSNGSALITVGANQVNQNITGNLALTTNNKRLTFTPLAGGSNVYFVQQNDDNFVFHSTNTINQPRPIWGVFGNSISSNLQIYVPLQLNAGIVANSSLGTAGQVLTSNGSATYWSTVTGGSGSVNTDAQYTWANIQTFNSNVVISNTAELVFATNSGIIANGSLGSSGQVLTTNGTTVYWSSVTGGGGAPTTNVITNTAFTAVKDNRYFLTNASPTTMTLPATPSAGDTVYVVVYNELSNNMINRNGSNIMSLAEDLTIDIKYASFGLTYATETTGWVIV